MSQKMHWPYAYDKDFTVLWASGPHARDLLSLVPLEGSHLRPLLEPLHVIEIGDPCVKANPLKSSD